ncbi:MAG: tRNA uridine-5-carboxymethylaminomethyl(34) synthesis GTPase MnmE, partial [Candidatus Competibacteraceae bacterium]|nr:tRNA uridine-5-carboxymethylaminomethyl(34) synthesis GTPase MnmE [Candidatus Competibacteraceae bacterium]
MNDTIAAVATPPGRGGVGIVRISGPLSAMIAEAICGVLPIPRQAVLRRFRAGDGSVLDEGIALYFPSPHSFTGEDVLELHGHGGPAVMDLLLARVLQLGARPARPGEFSERAFLNDKLDLVQAEAIADLIASTTAEAARAAVRSLEGAFSTQVHALVEGLIELRMYVEAAIDFPEEEIDFLADGSIAERLGDLRERLRALQGSARQGRLLRDGMTVVIAGQPNVGKSSLLNQLAGREAAIVTDIPGTTRDVLRESIAIDGMPLHVIDTAGLRESLDPVEQEGMRRAWTEIVAADRILLLVDDRQGLTAADRALRERLPGQTGVTVIYNKIDLSGREPALQTVDGSYALWLSVRTGAGLELLRAHLKACMGYHGGEGTLMARRRHLEALEQATAALAAAEEQLMMFRTGELAAEELRYAQNALGEITGEFTSDDLLGRIFGSFC